MPEQVPAAFSRSPREHRNGVLASRSTCGCTGRATAASSDAVLDLPIHAREYQAEAPSDEPGDDQLATPYLENGNLDLSAWARDAVALALPDKILCRPDCAGLCPRAART